MWILVHKTRVSFAGVRFLTDDKKLRGRKRNERALPCERGKRKEGCFLCVAKRDGETEC